MTAAINTLSNDVLRKILYQVSEGPNQIIGNQLVCKKWYDVYRNQMFWKMMYIRDFGKNGIEHFSDIANFKLIYQKKWSLTLDDDYNYMKIDQLTPENLVFGPVQSMYSQDIVVPVHFINWRTNNIAPRPFIVRGAGFQIKIKFPEQRRYYSYNPPAFIVSKLSPDFKITISQLTRYLSKHHEEIWTHGRNNVYFSNGKQYKSVSAVLDCDSVPVSEIVRGETTIDQNKSPICITPNGWDSDRNLGYPLKIYYIENNEIEKINIHNPRHSNMYKSCESGTITFDNATIECQFGGFLVSNSGDIRINMAIKKMWLTKL